LVDYEAAAFRKTAATHERTPMRPNCPICLILLAAVTVGCGRGNPLGRQAISGKVTLDDALLDYGTIMFGPQAPGGVSSGAVVTNGMYSIPTSQGLPPGKYLVHIASTAPNPKDTDRPADNASPEHKGMPGPGPAGLPGIDRIAPAYNVQSKIVIEVVAGQEGKFNFDVSSQ
jgi:hypothetical protein